MASISSGGIDVQAIVAQLMVKEQKKLDGLNNTYSSDKVKVSLYSQFKSVVNSLKTAIDNVGAAYDTTAYKVSSSDSDAVTASITNNVNMYAGKHTIAVTKLAQAGVYSSATPYTSKTDALGITGDLTFTVGASNFTVSVTSTDTLEQVRDKINNASSNVGAKASILSTTSGGGADEFKLVIASAETGTANNVSITGSAAATFDITNVMSIAQNAEFTFDSNSVVRSSNQITDVIDGLSFNLLASGGTTTLTIDTDLTAQNAAVTTAIKNMVTAYNNLIDFVDQATTSEKLTDATVSTVKMDIKNLFSNTYDVSGSITQMLDVGMVKTEDAVVLQTSKGKNFYSTRYEIDDEVLSKALSDDPDDVKRFFTETSEGFIKAADTAIEKITRYNGTIETQVGSINERMSMLTQAIGVEENRLDDVQLRLLKKYADLNSLISRSDQISSFLDSQMSGISIKK